MSENDTLNETPATDVAPEAHADQAPEQPPAHNEHVAEGCEKFDADPVKTALDKADAFIKQVEGSLGITKLQEAVMWFGMDLKRLNDGRTCYPESYNPSNTVVEPCADGLKL